MKAVYKTLPKAVLAGLGAGLSLRAIKAIVNGERLIQRGTEKDYGEILKSNPALIANRERKIRVPAIEPDVTLKRKPLPLNIALQSDVIDPEDVDTVKRLQAEKEAAEKTEYAPDTATALLSSRAKGRGVLGTLVDTFVPAELKPRLQREWIDATNPLGTFFRGTREYSLDPSGNPVPGDYVKNQKAWQIPASYPLWAATVGGSGLAAYYGLNHFMKKQKKTRLQNELDDARAQFEAALAYEANQSQRKRANDSNLLNACNDFHNELDRYEKLYNRLITEPAVNKEASYTKTYLGGVGTLTALAGLAALHRAFWHAKQREEQHRAYNLLKGKETPNEILSGFGERLLDRRFRSGYGFELTDTDPVSFDDSNLEGYESDKSKKKTSNR
jgi:hypothetical protein